MTDTLFEDFVSLLEQKDELKNALKGVERELRKKQTLVLDRMADQGLDRVRCNGRTLYPKSILRARCVGDRQQTADTLDAIGLDYLVARDFNLNRVSAHFREAAAELEGLGDPNTVLPEELRGLLELVESIEVGHTRS